MVRSGLIALYGGAVASALIQAAPVSAQIPPAGDAEPIAEYTLRDFSAKVMMQHGDLGDTARYRGANRELAAKPALLPRVVLLGASITFHWTRSRLPAAAAEIVNRGIPGQNSSQMLLRFQDDVIALRPAAVIIMEMTNDLRVFLRAPADPLVRSVLLHRLQQNIRAMADIAEANKVKVALASVPPIGPDHQRLQRDPETLRQANQWIRAFAASRGYPVLDLFQPIAAADGTLPATLGPDGLHPNADGYARLAAAMSATLDSLRRKRPQERSPFTEPRE